MTDQRKFHYIFIVSTILYFLTGLSSLSAQSEYFDTTFENPNGTTTSYSSSNNGIDVFVEDARGVTTQLNYSLSGQLQYELAPEKGLTQYFYDELGRPNQIEMESDLSVKIDYDDYNRVTKRVWRDIDLENIVTRYHYDSCKNGAGKLCKVTHNDNQTIYGYRPDGKLRFVKSKLSDEQAVETISYKYDDLGRLDSMQYPSGLRVIYGYNDNGRIRNIMGQYETGSEREVFTVIKSVKYDDVSGQILKFTHGNGVVTRYQYTPSGAVAQITRSKDRNFIGNDSYDYGSDGALLGIDRLNSDYSRRYGYDGSGRLLYESHGDGSADTSMQIAYSYDESGNRIKRTMNARTKTYQYAPDKNQLMMIGRKGLVYDARGNLIEDRNGRRKFAYDATNRMVAYYENDELRARYDYDAKGRRIHKVLSKPGVDGEKSIRFMYDSEGRLVSETSRREDKTAFRAKDIVWFGPIAVAQINRRINSEGVTRKADVLSLHIDHIGAPREATNANGTIVWRWHGDAFGAKAGDKPAIERDVDGDGKKIEISLRFPGQYHDRESGLWYNHYRDYDAKLGRYIQSDPIGLLGGPNRYTYVSNKPVTLIDPMGLAEICYGTNHGYSGSGNSSDYEPSGTPDDSPVNDEVIGTGTRSENGSTYVCIHIPDPPMPSVPSVPTVPTGPTGGGGDGGETSEEEEERHQCTPEDDAIADAVREAFTNSDSNVVEYGGLIYQNADGSIGSTGISGTFTGVPIWDSFDQVPSDATVIAGWHTHPEGPLFLPDGSYLTGTPYYSSSDYIVARNYDLYGNSPPEWGGLGLGVYSGVTTSIYRLPPGAAADPGYSSTDPNQGAVDISHCGSTT